MSNEYSSKCKLVAIALKSAAVQCSTMIDQTMPEHEALLLLTMLDDIRKQCYKIVTGKEEPQNE